MGFVPEDKQTESSPCRFIPLTGKGETIDFFYRCGTQPELEEALAGWLREQITRIEQKHGQVSCAEDEFSKLAET